MSIKLKDTIYEVINSANKLSNSRTIWGQSFNGEGNVDGALKNATTGSFSSNVTIGGNLTINGTSLYLKDYLMMNSGEEGIYMHSTGISWHDTSNTYSTGLIAFELNSILFGQKITTNSSVNVSNNLCVGEYVNLYASERAQASVISTTTQPSMFWLGSGKTQRWGIECRGENEDYVMSLYSWSAGKHFVRITHDGKFALNTEIISDYNLDVNGSFNATSGYINKNAIIHSGNIGSQSVSYATSAGNANTLDNKHASDFSLAHSHPYLSTSGGTITGILNVIGDSSTRANINLVSKADIPNDLYFGSAETKHWSITSRSSEEGNWIGLYNAKGSWVFKVSYENNILDFMSNPTVNGYKLWNAGNDGNNSGLDADLLDGKHLHDIYGWANDKNLNNHQNGTGITYYAYDYSASSSVMNKPTGDSVTGARGVLTFDNSYPLQISWSYNDAGNFYARTKYSGTWSSWVQFATVKSNVESSNKLKTARNIAIQGAVTGNADFDGSSAITISTSVNHTHNYAGSSSAGGAATSANKLATTRTIWGQSFDGSGNVSGALSGATTGSFSSNVTVGNNLTVNGTHIYAKTYLMMGNGGEGIYLTNNGLHWHNSSNAWTKSILSFNSSAAVNVHYNLCVGALTDIYENTRAQASVISTTNHPSMLWLGSNSEKKWSIECRGESDDYAFSMYSWVNSSHVIRVLHDGNVGIGTSNPSTKLHITGPANVEGHFSVGKVLGSTSQERAELSLVTSGAYPCDLMLGADGTQYWSISARNSGEGVTGKALLFHNYNLGAAMWIGANNNVSIGGNPSSYKLDVNGSLGCSTFYIGGEQITFTT